MQWFSPLFARGRGTARFIESLINGEPVSWAILGVIAVIFIGYLIIQANKSSSEVAAKDETPRNVYEIPNTPSTLNFCPSCGMRVIPMADGTCPGCRQHKFELKSKSS
jgi:hypothetical protein